MDFVLGMLCGFGLSGVFPLLRAWQQRRRMEKRARPDAPPSPPEEQPEWPPRPDLEYRVSPKPGPSR